MSGLSGNVGGGGGLGTGAGGGAGSASANAIIGTWGGLTPEELLGGKKWLKFAGIFTLIAWVLPLYSPRVGTSSWSFSWDILRSVESASTSTLLIIIVAAPLVLSMAYFYGSSIESLKRRLWFAVGSSIGFGFLLVMAFSMLYSGPISWMISGSESGLSELTEPVISKVMSLIETTLTLGGGLAVLAGASARWHAPGSRIAAHLSLWGGVALLLRFAVPTYVPNFGDDYEWKFIVVELAKGLTNEYSGSMFLGILMMLVPIVCVAVSSMWLWRRHSRPRSPIMIVYVSIGMFFAAILFWLFGLYGGLSGKSGASFFMAFSIFVKLVGMYGVFYFVLGAGIGRLIAAREIPRGLGDDVWGKSPPLKRMGQASHGRPSLPSGTLRTGSNRPILPTGKPVSDGPAFVDPKPEGTDSVQAAGEGPGTNGPYGGGSGEDRSAN